MKNNKILPLILGLALVLVIVGAAVGYKLLSGRVKPVAPQPTAQSTTAAVTAAPAQDKTTSAAPAEADLAADFTVYDEQHHAVKLSAMRGKPTVVNVWATWCPPCRSELPHFQALYEAYGDEVNFMMVDVGESSGDTVEDVKAFVDENGYTFPMYYDADGSAAYAYGVNSIPVTLFIDKDGRLADSTIGAMDEQTLSAYLDTIR